MDALEHRSGPDRATPDRRRPDRHEPDRAGPDRAAGERGGRGAPSNGAPAPVAGGSTRVQLDDERPPPPPIGGLTAWILPPLLLSASLVAVFLVLRGPDRLFLWALAAMFGLALLWVLVSVFFPASVDRTCPGCGEPGLERLDPSSTRGLACTRCGWRDTTASSFLMAEAEGPFEEVVLNERRRRRDQRRNGRRAGRSGAGEPAR